MVFFSCTVCIIHVRIHTHLLDSVSPIDMPFPSHSNNWDEPIKGHSNSTNVLPKGINHAAPTCVRIKVYSMCAAHMQPYYITISIMFIHMQCLHTVKYL